MAVKSFWENRESAKQRQLDSGAGDRGERASVTAGRNMDGFLEMLLEIIRANGLSQAEMYQKLRCGKFELAATEGVRS